MTTTTTTIELIGGKIIETTINTTVVEHYPAEILARLEYELASTIDGRDEYLVKVNSNIETIENKIKQIKELM